MSSAPFQSHSETSRLAAVSVETKVVSMKKRVLTAITNAWDGLTDEEIVQRLGMPGNSVRPRRIELVREGLIREAGKRKTLSGRLAVVWRRVGDSHLNPVESAEADSDDFIDYMRGLG